MERWGLVEVQVTSAGKGPCAPILGLTGDDWRAGLISFTKLFVGKYAKHGVRMNNVLPGWINSKPEQEAHRAAVPMQRYGTVEEIAATMPAMAARTSAARTFAWMVS